MTRYSIQEIDCGVNVTPLLLLSAKRSLSAFFFKNIKKGEHTPPRLTSPQRPCRGVPCRREVRWAARPPSTKSDAVSRGLELIRVPVKTRVGVYRVMRTRVPRTATFELYRKALEEAPELLQQIYAIISHDVEARATEPVERSTVLVERIPADWPYRNQWLKFLDSDSERRSFFEQVLWTYFFDRQETWETTWPDKDRKGAEYTRAAVMPPAAVAATS